MPATTNRTGSRVIAALASRRFFIIILAFFVLEALWFALSAVYPMAFDEEFHYGIIQLFSDHGPFMGSQPESADKFGAIIRDPSFLYHYLMSFPYRLITLFTENQTTIVIILRLLNIALFAWSLVLFRKVLLRAKLSPAFTHTALAIFVLVPIVPQLAAHINYDNMLILLVAWMCLLVAGIIDGLQNRRVAMRQLLLLLLACMASSIVKYESLPIVAAVLLFAIFMVWYTFRASLGSALCKGWRVLSGRTKFGLIALFVVLFGLIIQRYGMNVWTYQALKPGCDAVLDERRCQAYGPWARNHWLAQHKGEFNHSPVAYTWVWLQSLHYRSFFAVSGVTNGYTNYPPLPMPAATAIVITVSGASALLLYRRRIFAGNKLLILFACMATLYLGALWFEDYSQFLETGRPVAINGRYLIPILLPIAAIFGRALSIALNIKPAIKPFVATAAVVLFLYGGGVFTFIVRSDLGWYWPNRTVINVNEHAQRLLQPVIFEGGKYY